MMKKTFLAGAAVAAIAVATQASAADLAVRAPVYKAPPTDATVFSWTGCYVGGHVGWGWSRKKIDETAIATVSRTTRTVNVSGNIDASGAVFGGQIGCNYQFASNFVIGVEGSASATDINGSNLDPYNAAFPGTDDDNYNRVKMDWLASITGRVGVVVGNVLWYAKGGAAWARDRWNVSDTLRGEPHVERLQTRTGWTAGVGAEWAWSFAPRWSSFVVYEYYDFR